MAPISTKAHGVIDYAAGAATLAAPSVLRIRDRRAAAALWGAGAGVIGAPAVTDELALRWTLPVPAHLVLDAVAGPPRQPCRGPRSFVAGSPTRCSGSARLRWWR